MYSWSKNWPTLTELFFGKGIDSATDKPFVKAAPKKVVAEKKVVSKKKELK